MAVVYHLVPTSNHNRYSNEYNGLTLFIILFLHQTTTSSRVICSIVCCLSSCSYIKPQQRSACLIYENVVYHLVPTSNHNYNSIAFFIDPLFIILFLHQTTTAALGSSSDVELFIILFLHQTTTKELSLPYSIMLFIILFLHQTTTMKIEKTNYQQLFIILFLHQTTTVITCSYFRTCCLSSCSYIKPQQSTPASLYLSVVYHLVPTSNHNSAARCQR